MSSSLPAKRVRKTPEARRAEIVGKAAEIALAEGLEMITLRRVADELGVRPGLIGHYFPVAEDLPSEAFGEAAEAELDQLIPADPAGSPLDRLAAFLAKTGGPAYDGMSRLWLNARHLSRYRAGLAERVAYQEAHWRGRLTALIRDGVEAGEFRCADAATAAVWILVVLDGLGVHANTTKAEAELDRPSLAEWLVVTTAERELGLPAGSVGERWAASEPGRVTDAGSPSGTGRVTDAGSPPGSGPVTDADTAHAASGPADSSLEGEP